MIVSFPLRAGTDEKENFKDVADLHTTTYSTVWPTSCGPVFTFSLLPYEYNSITISYWISALRFD
jgi:hypothetical protein